MMPLAAMAAARSNRHPYTMPLKIGVGRLGLFLAGLAVVTRLAWYILRGTDLAILLGWVVPAVALVNLAELLGCGCAWASLVETPRPSCWIFFRMRWIRASVANLVPVSGIGAALVAVRLAMQTGLAMDMAGASLTLDATMEMATQVLYTALGLGLLLALAQQPRLWGWSAAILSVAVLLLGALVGVQRGGGLKLVDRGISFLAARWPRLKAFATIGLHDRLMQLHGEPRRSLVCGSFHV
jgi:hypothetical protein